MTSDVVTILREAADPDIEVREGREASLDHAAALLRDQTLALEILAEITHAYVIQTFLTNIFWRSGEPGFTAGDDIHIVVLLLGDDLIMMMIMMDWCQRGHVIAAVPAMATIF